MYFLAPEEWSVDFSWSSKYEDHPYTGYVKKKNIKWLDFSTNNIGFCGRDDFLPSGSNNDTMRIVVCGGSTVEQTDLGREEPFEANLTWPKIMENELRPRYPYNITVLNAGITGYTSLESLIHFQLRCLPLKPHFAIFYHGINDAWQIQSCQGFVEDHTHSRKPAVFNKFWFFIYIFPNIRPLYFYQIIKLKIWNKIQKVGGKGLFPVISKKVPFKTDYSQIDRAVTSFQLTIRSFCAICEANNIIPILIPWKFDPDSVGELHSHEHQDRDKLLELLMKNNKAIVKVSEEFKTAILIEGGDLGPENFRVEAGDWIHFSKQGLVTMGSTIAKSLTKFLPERL